MIGARHSFPPPLDPFPKRLSKAKRQQRRKIRHHRLNRSSWFPASIGPARRFARRLIACVGSIAHYALTSGMSAERWNRHPAIALSVDVLIVVAIESPPRLKAGSSTTTVSDPTTLTLKKEPPRYVGIAHNRHDIVAWRLAIAHNTASILYRGSSRVAKCMCCLFSLTYTRWFKPNPLFCFVSQSVLGVRHIHSSSCEEPL